MKDENKNKLNEFGYAEVIGTVVMIISSSFFIAGILIALLSWYVEYLFLSSSFLKYNISSPNIILTNIYTLINKLCIFLLIDYKLY